MTMNNANHFSVGVLKLLNKLNSFLLAESSRSQCRKFVINDMVLGFIRQDCLDHLLKFPEVFVEGTNGPGKGLPNVYLNSSLDTPESRSKAVEEVMNKLRDTGDVYTLKGWRNELFSIRPSISEEPLLYVERSGTSLFGAVTYGCHCNGYTIKDGQIYMWIAKRSKTKPTYPGMFDNMCGGGLTKGLGIKECILKECAEEASITPEMGRHIKQVGCISYIFEDKRGVFPEIEFVFDLELPESFVPENADGEVESFNLLPMDKVKELMIGGQFKTNSACIALDFMIRHGIITSDNEPNYCKIVESLHIPLKDLLT